MEANLKVAISGLIACGLFLSSYAPAQAPEKVDLDMVTKIRYEGFHNSQIRDIAKASLKR
jgi:hypothetical protein